MFRFRWQIEGKLAGMGRPDISRPAGGEDPEADAWLSPDLHRLKERGITAVVSLTSRPLDQEAVEAAGFRYHHIPVQDFSAPTQEQIDRFVAFAREEIERDGKVVVHCFAGIGRTGTMLACYLVREGKTAEEAMREVRRVETAAIEVPSQEEAVREYARRRSDG